MNNKIVMLEESCTKYSIIGEVVNYNVPTFRLLTLQYITTGKMHFFFRLRAGLSRKAVH